MRALRGRVKGARGKEIWGRKRGILRCALSEGVPERLAPARRPPVAPLFAPALVLPDPLLREIDEGRDIATAGDVMRRGAWCG